MTWFGWLARGRKAQQADLSDLLEPLPTYSDKAQLLDGLPCCCLAVNGSGQHDSPCCPDCAAPAAFEED